MKFHAAFLVTMALGARALTADPEETNVPQLSLEQSTWLAERDLFTPAFRATVHDLVDTREEVAQIGIDEIRLRSSLGDLGQQRDQEKGRVDALRK